MEAMTTFLAMQQLPRMLLNETNGTEAMLNLTDATLNSTVTPTIAPSAAPNPWLCEQTEEADPIAPYECHDYVNTSMAANGGPEFGSWRVHPSLPGHFWLTFGCFKTGTDFALTERGPTTTGDDCLSFCLMASYDGRGMCRGCALLDSGELAYDCRNLFSPPQQEELTETEEDEAYCLARDGTGKCYARDRNTEDDYFHWSCIPHVKGVGGFTCSYKLYPWARDVVYNPALGEISSEAPGSVTTLYCAKDIAGFYLVDCEQPLCTIILQIDPLVQCADCEVTPEASFAYDCSEFFPGSYNLTTCPIRLPNGTCTEPLSEQPRAIWIPGVNQTQMRSFSATTDSSSSDEWAWTLKRIHPTAFNVVSDIFSHLTRLAVGAAIASLYGCLLTWQIYSRQPVRLDLLGQLPGDSVQGLGAIAKWKWSGPVLCLVVLLLMADFSHSIADVGLDFVTVEQEGPDDTILVINTDRRNHNRPMEFAGDPINTRTSVWRDTTDDEEARSNWSVIRSYLDGVKAIARGGSPFLTYGPSGESSVRTNLPLGGVPDFLCFFMPDDSPLVEIDNEIPVQCSSSEMLEFRQISTGQTHFDAEVRTLASLPDCSFSETRSTGIHNGPTGSAQVLEHADMINVWYDSGVLLRNGTSEFVVFEASRKSKRLARDRGDDWAKGRIFGEIDGAVIGNITIDFGRVVVATGVEVDPNAFTGNRQNDYGLVAQITTECPPRPSGFSVVDTSCFALLSLSCESFQEDYTIKQHELYGEELAPSPCRTDQFSLIWGRNFDADPEFVSALAGVYGLVKPHLGDLSIDEFRRSGALAALFAMATVGELPAKESIVRPRINMVYVVFMALPIILCLSIIALVRSSSPRCLPIPETFWELMVLAKDEPLIPRRTGIDGEEFPPMPDNLYFEFGRERNPCVVCRDNFKRGGTTGAQDEGNEQTPTPAETHAKLEGSSSTPSETAVDLEATDSREVPDLVTKLNEEEELKGGVALTNQVTPLLDTVPDVEK